LPFAGYGPAPKKSIDAVNLVHICQRFCDICAHTNEHINAIAVVNTDALAHFR